MSFLKDNWEALLTPLGLILTFFAGWKFKKAETQIKRGDALANMQLGYDEWVTDGKQRVADIREEMGHLQDNFALLQKSNFEQSFEINNLRKVQNQVQEEKEIMLIKYKDLEKKYASLKRQFDELKQKYNKVNKISGNES
jgi:chromosome segregation ATPase